MITLTFTVSQRAVVHVDVVCDQIFVGDAAHFYKVQLPKITGEELKIRG